jgi:hypothetical protein
VAAKYFGDDQLTVAALRPQPVDPAMRKKRAPRRRAYAPLIAGCHDERRK